MRFADYLNEVYVTRAKEGFEIFKNPTLQELRGIDDLYGIRFIVDTEKKDIYCFEGGTLHEYAYKALGFKYGDMRFWDGVGEYKKGKIEGYLITDWNIKYWPWLAKWIIPGIKG